MDLQAPISASFYEQRAQLHQRQHDQFARRALHVSNLRGLTFILFAGAAGFSLFGHAGTIGVIVSLTGLVSFVVLAVRHGRILESQNLEERWVRANRDAAARVTAGAWHKLPQTGEQFRNANHPYSDDLDVFGTGSLFQRICVAQTHMGHERLFQWLTGTTSENDLEQRRIAVKALAPELDYRQELEVLCLGTRDNTAQGDAPREPGDIDPLFTWAEELSPEHLRRNYSAIAWTLPAITVLGVVLGYRGNIPVSLALIAPALSLWALVRARSHMASLIGMLATAERTVNKAGAVFALLERNASLLRMDQRLGGAVVPSVALAALSRVGSWFELRHNGLVYPFANVLLLWDIHCWLAFEHWRKRHGGVLRQWFTAIGDAEALSSLAGFYHDEPACCFAEVVQDECGFEAIELGHALIHPDVRVTNDVTGLKPGYGLLVTGSNMSGKSTYLRAIGLAAILGLAGGPICAKRLRMNRLLIATSMRVSDNLASGVSHFYAELQKLRRALDEAQGPLPVLFLLDEILHGTNSRERQIGARFILTELLRAGALGAVSTHDSALCELSGELAERLRLVHFRESLTGSEMTFDYRLHSGAVTSGNALRLMQKLGIDVPLE